ncbi:MAG: Kazal-type serine protease inhibitor domain-containing protein, partial [Sandaracinaceae bacterium]|nr:Kazal-type serine protease inhibitor domain-containing protein [Sandaracinaceae bacterium]
MDNITTFRPRHFLRPFAVLACGLGVAPLMGVQCQPVVGPPPKACSEVFEPVCGVDGRTYGNRCEAEAAGVDVAHEGACDGCRPVRCGCAHGRMEIDSSTGCPSCRCAPSFCMNDEECGIGEYCDRSECASPCAPGEICPDVCYGTCRLIPTVCPEIYAPVCGADGRTYGNRCEAERAMVAVLHEGECRGDWVCPEVYEPVCGENGRTYSNLCYAKRAGVGVVHMGECEGDACGRIVC